MSSKDILIFQDVVKDQQDDEALSLAFFELANVPVVGYRLPLSKKNKVVTVHQDTSACGTHTGGIVWETSYLLMNYLVGGPSSSCKKKTKLGRVLEVGAGCGLLGQVLAASSKKHQVVMTECQEVMKNLQSNMERNMSCFTKKRMPVVQKLDWLDYEKDAIEELKPHSFDTIVGTDVVFATSLVEPLLGTLRYMAHQHTIVYLCIQIRCEDSHKLLFQKAPNFGWSLTDMTNELANIPQCTWGIKMDCRLLKLTMLGEDKKRKTSSDQMSSKMESSHKKKRKK